MRRLMPKKRKKQPVKVKIICLIHQKRPFIGVNRVREPRGRSWVAPQVGVEAQQLIASRIGIQFPGDDGSNRLLEPP